MKTLEIIECRRCGGSYYSGKEKVILYPAEGNNLSEELYILLRKIGQCSSCKENVNRTRGQKRNIR